MTDLLAALAASIEKARQERLVRESAPRWFCDQHRKWTTGDCASCDDELIALTERNSWDDAQKGDDQ